MRFKPLSAFECGMGGNYSMLPFRFMPFDSDTYLLTGFAGEYLLLHKDELHQFVRHRLSIGSETYNALKSRHFLIDADSSVAIDLLATKYRTRQSFLSRFTSLFMFVVTLRCDHACRYCQASRKPRDCPGYDMSKDNARRAVDFVFRTPSPVIKVEFQGGEPLLNFDIVKYIVERVEERNSAEGREVVFVLATNLSPLTDDMLRFCLGHDVHISTSLDGPADIHNANRPKEGCDSYAEVVTGIRRARDILGAERLSALMTTTKVSLLKPREIVDEYVRLGFRSIFLRPLNPYGLAASSGLAGEYEIADWIRFYKEALAYIIELNRNSCYIREEFASLLLRRVLTSYPTGYVDLQSPAGTGISCVVLNYDGGVYASDESRMLAEMGDFTFRLGSLATDSYEDIMFSDRLLSILMDTMTEGVPGCSDCACQPYCGSDPVRHYRSQGDMVGFKPTSEFCRKHMGIIKHLIGLLENDPSVARILRSWAN